MIKNEVDQNENDIKDFKLLNTDLKNTFTQTFEEANKSVKGFVETLKTNVVANKDSQLQCEKVSYLNKKEISKSSNEPDTKSESKSEHLDNKTNQVHLGLLDRFTKVIWKESSSFLIPVGILLFSYIIYSIYY